MYDKLIVALCWLSRENAPGLILQHAKLKPAFQSWGQGEQATPCSRFGRAEALT
jgi:hypothetical protein